MSPGLAASGSSVSPRESRADCAARTSPTSCSGADWQSNGIACEGISIPPLGFVRSDSSGYFVFPLLSPGRYKLRIGAASYQPQELHELDLAVASRIDFLFRLRPLSDVWEQGQIRSVQFPDS